MPSALQSDSTLKSRRATARGPQTISSVQEASGWSLAQAAELDGAALVVSIGVIRHPSEDLIAGGIAASKVLNAFTQTPITNSKAAQLGVGLIKSAVDKASARLRPERIDLYYAEPAAFTVALGRGWNALPPTSLFEFDSVRRSYARRCDTRRITSAALPASVAWCRRVAFSAQQGCSKPHHEYTIVYFREHRLVVALPQGQGLHGRRATEIIAPPFLKSQKSKTLSLVCGRGLTFLQGTPRTRASGPSSGWWMSPPSIR